MTLPRYVKQPGPALAERVLSVEARLHAFQIELQAGVLLLDAVQHGFEARGFSSGIVRLEALALHPFAYVMPALSETSDHAAFYSAVFRPTGTSSLRCGSLTFGQRDGAPFFHCHALWQEADGKISGGHILPEETTIARTATVQAYGLSGAQFQGNFDPETNFRLFEPVDAHAFPQDSAAQAYAMRLRPNQDFATALERFCEARGIASARVLGGVGSTIGAKFIDGRVVENFATEIFLRNGEVTRGSEGTHVAALDVSLVDYTGAIAEGRMLRGDNPVLMTVELVLEVC